MLPAYTQFDRTTDQFVVSILPATTQQLPKCLAVGECSIYGKPCNIGRWLESAVYFNRLEEKRLKKSLADDEGTVVYMIAGNQVEAVVTQPYGTNKLKVLVGVSSDKPKAVELALTKRTKDSDIQSALFETLRGYYGTGFVCDAPTLAKMAFVAC